MPIIDPYWLVRSRAFMLEIPIFGEKSSMQRNIELSLFNSLNTQDISRIFSMSEESKIKASIDLFERKYRKIDAEQTNEGKR